MPLVGLFMLCGVNVGVMAGTSVIQLNEEFSIGKKGLCHCHLEVKENEYWDQLVTLQTSPDRGYPLIRIWRQNDNTGLLLFILLNTDI